MLQDRPDVSAGPA